MKNRGSNRNARDKNNITPFLLAASNASQDTIQALIDARANVADLDIEERSALYWASKRGNLPVVRLLLTYPEGRALVNKGDRDENTPLHVASEKGHLEVAKVLVEHGAQIDAKNDDEDTPLINAAYDGHAR